MSFINRTYTFTDGTTAFGSQVDSEISNIVNTINACDTGSTIWDTIKVTTLLPQANVAMGGFKLTGLANGSASGDSVAFGQISSLATAVTGSILTYISKTSPSGGYLYCDGSAVSRGTYAALFAVLGSSFGSGDGSTTFNLPDLRGKFVRGVNDGTGNDPDASARTAQASGGNTGDAVGSIQADQFKSHTHTATVTDPQHNHVIGQANAAGQVHTTIAANVGNSRSDTFTSDSNSTGVTVSNANTGGNESRPLNVYFYYHIKT